MSNAKLQKGADKLSLKMLKKFGGKATFIHIEETEDEYGDITETETEYSISTYATKATADELKSGAVSVTQVVYLVAASSLPFQPTSADKIKMNGVVLGVDKGFSVSGGQTSVLYRLVCGV